MKLANGHWQSLCNLLAEVLSFWFLLVSVLLKGSLGHRQSSFILILWMFPKARVKCYQQRFFWVRNSKWVIKVFQNVWIKWFVPLCAMTLEYTGQGLTLGCGCMRERLYCSSDYLPSSYGFMQQFSMQESDFTHIYISIIQCWTSCGRNDSGHVQLPFVGSPLRGSQTSPWYSHGC